MPDAQKKYRARLKGHTEEWTQAEHDLVQKTVGDRFNEYAIELIQPPTPADVPSTPARARATSTNTDTPAA